MTEADATRRWPAIAILVLGIGLAVAPLAFGMFERAPKGGDMIDGFAPYMDEAKMAQFRGFLAQMDETRAGVIHLDATIDDGTVAEHPAMGAFIEEYPGISDDMGSMLDTMEDNLGNYRGVAALPPFPLFPWFFVMPGAMLALAGALWLRYPLATRPGVVAAFLGVGLLAAPMMFQMFTRAPGGAEMIGDFESLMTTERVNQMQGYFLVIGSAEGDLRRQIVPAWQDAADADPATLAVLTDFSQDWPTISNQMAPMIGTMADNVDNFAAVVALPDFALFPWFFLLPGVLVVGVAMVDRRRRGVPLVVFAAPDIAGMRLSTLQRLRAASAVAAVGSLVALAVLALLAERGEIDFAYGPAATPLLQAPASEVTDTVDTSMPVVLSPAPRPPSVPEPPPAPTRTPTSNPQDDSPEPPPTSPEPELAACALGLPPPDRTGGLASLTPLIPGFGPFAPEAFVFSPAYEPLMDLFGPFLPVLADQLAAHPEQSDAIVTLMRQLTTSGYDTVEPFYGPYREDFLAGAAQLANTLAPYSEALGESPAATCLVALEGIMVDGAPGAGRTAVDPETAEATPVERLIVSVNSLLG